MPSVARTGIWVMLAMLLPVLTTLPAAAQSKRVPVDLELAFVVDASGSIDDMEMRLQQQGYVDALSHPKILRAIRNGVLGSIAVAYVEFAGPYCERLSVGWTRITDRASALAFGKRILAQGRLDCFGGNAISDAVLLAAQTIRDNGFEGTRLVIDVSGDGPNTLGPAMVDVRDAVVSSGIVINALAIHRESYPDLDDYYRQVVTGGPGAFVIKAESRASFAAAILRKMVREIVDLEGAPRPAAAALAADNRAGWSVFYAATRENGASDGN